MLVKLLPTPPVWDMELVSSMSRKFGFEEKLDENHSAYYLPAGPKLVVVFEANAACQTSAALKLQSQMQMFSEAGFSVLGISARQANWYRSDAVKAFLETCKANGPIWTHSECIFFGVSMGGYAAAAYAAFAKKARVIAITPQATLDRSLTNGWETRFKEGWKEDFSDPSSYAPDGVKNAKEVWLFHDPHVAPDALHVALFRGSNIRSVRCRHFDEDLSNVLVRMGIWQDLMLGLAAGKLSELDVYQLLRKRRDTPAFQKIVLSKLSPQEKTLRTYQYCKAVLERSKGTRPHFVHKMQSAAKLCGKPGPV